MSYDIYLTDPVSGEALEIPQPHFMGGGNQCLYGTNTLCFFDNDTSKFEPTQARRG